jgi:hypothetical protein
MTEAYVADHGTNLMSLSNLIQVCAPPSRPTDFDNEGRLREIQSRYGLLLPEEYVQFTRVYGTGEFCSDNTHYIIIFNPFSLSYFQDVEYGYAMIHAFFTPTPSSSIVSHLVRDRPDLIPRMVAHWQHARKKPQAAGIEVGWLLPLGHDTDDGILAWVVRPNEPKWSVLVFYTDRAGYQFELFNFGLCDFLAGYFASQLTVSDWSGRLEDGRVQKYWFEPAIFGERDQIG